MLGLTVSCKCGNTTPLELSALSAHELMAIRELISSEIARKKAAVAGKAGQRKKTDSVYLEELFNWAKHGIVSADTVPDRIVEMRFKGANPRAALGQWLRWQSKRTDENDWIAIRLHEHNGDCYNYRIFNRLAEE